MRRLPLLIAVTASLLLAVASLGGYDWMVAPLEARLLYSPWPADRARLEALASAGERIEEVRLAMPDGVTLHGWLKRPRVRAGKRYPLVIVYGGVRREVSEFVRRSDAARDWGWLVVNYRGFGLSEGAPNGHLVVEDGKRIYDWAAARPDVDRKNIVVLGRSLGTFVAVSVAEARNTRAAILATPFDSFAALAERHLPATLVDWMLAGRYDPAALAPRVSAPALFVLAEKDTVTPAENGRALASRWGGATKTVLLAGAGHGGIERRDEFWRSVSAFLAALRTSSRVP
ncbi:MAG TPA: alpha/beta hydrolase [Burkholderiales bacterium]|nr:alpha/beta hydrolase [Burkholderiales bacterium]